MAQFRDYSWEKYVEVTEKNPHPILQMHMQAEFKIIHNITKNQRRDFVDLGAGHGRILPILCPISERIIAIEINPSMMPELRKRVAECGHAQAIQGDIVELCDTLKNTKLQSPVLLLLQNSLGTIEGDYLEVLKSVKDFAQQYKGAEIVLSLFRQQALRKWGVDLYSSISHMVGSIDDEKTDFEKGIFVSKTGYVSKWWTNEDIEMIKSFFDSAVSEAQSENFCILHFKF